MTPATQSRWLRVLLVLVLLVAILVLLFTVVFPAVTSRLQDPTLGALPTAPRH